MTSLERFEACVAFVKSEVPRFGVVLKSKSKLHRAIGWCLAKVGNPQYMESYWTTLDNTVGRPLVCETGTPRSEWKIILHEGRHALDSRRISGVLFKLFYLLPQLLALPVAALAVLAVWHGLVWLWALAGLVLLAPVPALGRAWLEWRAYRVTMIADFVDFGFLPDVYIEDLVHTFAGAGYYWMWPFKSAMRRRIKNWRDDLVAGTAKFDAYEAACFRLVLKLAR